MGSGNWIVDNLNSEMCIRDRLDRVYELMYQVAKK